MPNNQEITQEAQLLAMRHSAEHVLTMAMEQLYGSDEKSNPIIIKAMGPAIADGFYFDFDIATSATAKGFKITEKDFPKIEKAMRKLIQQDLLMEKIDVSMKVARQIFANNIYKQELLDGLANAQDFEISESVSDGKSMIKQQMLEQKPSKLTLYLTGRAEQIAADKKLLAGLEMMSNNDQASIKLASFVDLCKGPHVAKISEIKAFKLLSIAGAYWCGDEKNKMLTRIYGTAFASQAALDDYLAKKQMAEERNHRKIGKEMELFAIIPEIGQGLPVWLPNGYAMRRVIEDYMMKMERRFGYVHILTPHLNRKELFEKSGHLGFYAENMYPPLVYEEKDASGKVIGQEAEVYYPKPMNCPAGIMVYKLKNHSYRDLPIKMGEFGTVYRREKSGELHGLQRVRGFTQNDAHIYCTPEQLKDQFKEVMSMLDIFYKDIGFNNYHFRLSISDPDKAKFQSCGKRSDWEKAENIMREILNEAGVQYVEAKGEAAFYGPKLDVQAVNVFGKEDSISTIQVDFNLPERLDVFYIDEKGVKQRPFVIHRALIGSFERFFAFLIEHYGGDFPVWFAPVQVRILPIADRHLNYARQLMDQLLDEGVRVEIDDRSERLQAKIRASEVSRVPIMLIIGDNELAAKQVGMRVRGQARERAEALIKAHQLEGVMTKSGDLGLQSLEVLEKFLKK